jgi:ubiquinone/menaquinone biosynthesis C-methylase UbiE
MAVDNAQYEKVVGTYDSILGTAVRRCDTLNMFHSIGSVDGKNVLDLSTGTGYFALVLCPRRGLSTLLGSTSARECWA